MKKKMIMLGILVALLVIGSLIVYAKDISFSNIKQISYDVLDATAKEKNVTFTAETLIAEMIDERAVQELRNDIRTTCQNLISTNDVDLLSTRLGDINNVK